MDRRLFLKQSVKTGLPIVLGASILRAGKPVFHSENVKVKMITNGPLNHFFGYYGVNPWNDDKTHLLSIETTFNDRLPFPGEKANIGLVDMKTGNFAKVSETRAWNMQQGCMLNWNPHKPNDEFYYNDIVDNKLVSVSFNLNSGNKTVQPYSISGITSDGNFAINLDYGRISRLRKVVSYSGTVDENPGIPHPDNSGVFVFNLKTGERNLVVSYKKVADEIKRYQPEIANRDMWIEHAEFNPSGNRLLLLPRTWDDSGKKLETGMYTVGIDGSELREVIPYGKDVSHWDWRNDNEIVATFNYSGTGKSHVLLTDGEKNYHVLPGLNWDGHCSFNSNGNFMVTDNYEKGIDMHNSVCLFDMGTNKNRVIATFDMLEKRFLNGDTRCDLHPRWSNNSEMVCVDAIDPRSTTRQIFVISLV